MCQFPLFETLAVRDGKFQNLIFHQQRVNNAFQHFFRSKCILNLAEIAIPIEFQQGFFRCRIDYSQSDFIVSFYPYQPRKIERFQLVYTDNLDYQFKYSDRKRLNFQEKLSPQLADEVIIINNGFVSDCSIGNLLFYKKGKWFSPQHYLLKGTQLSYLLDQNKVTLLPIKAEEIFSFEQIMLINALNPFDLTRAIPISASSILC